MSKAELIFLRKRFYDDGAVMEMRIWRVPEQVAGSDHWLKYSLYYGKHGERLVGCDNERGKGDHRHYGAWEEAYAFKSPEGLIADFLADVVLLRGDEE